MIHCRKKLLYRKFLWNSAILRVFRNILIGYQNESSCDTWRAYPHIFVINTPNCDIRILLKVLPLFLQIQNRNYGT